MRVCVKERQRDRDNGGGETEIEERQRETQWNVKTDKEAKKEFSKQRKEVRDNEIKFTGKGEWRDVQEARWTQFTAKRRSKGWKESRPKEGMKGWWSQQEGPLLPGPLTDGCCSTLTSQWKLPSFFFCRFVVFSKVTCSVEAAAPGMLYGALLGPRHCLAQ